MTERPVAGSATPTGVVHPVVGAWRVAVQIPSVGMRGENLALLAADGTMLVAFPSPTPAPPDQHHRLEYWTPAVGSWDAAGERGARLAFVALGADENGAPVGSHTVTATVEADAGGTSWSGPFRIAVVGSDGAAVASLAGTVTATRIAVG